MGDIFHRRQQLYKLTHTATTHLLNPIGVSNGFYWCIQNPFWVALSGVTLLSLWSAALIALVEPIAVPFESTWLIDSTSPVPTTNDLQDFSIYQAFNTISPLDGTVNTPTITLFNGAPAHGSGTVMLEISDWPDTSRYRLLNVLYAPSQPRKISLGIFARARKRYPEARRAKEEGIFAQCN